MSHLRELPPEVLDALLVGSTRITVPGGSVTHWEGEPEPHLELVLAGVVRVYVSAPDGRTLTVRYCRTGALSWASSRCTRSRIRHAGDNAGGGGRGVAVHRPCRAAAALADRDVRVARALLVELSERAAEFGGGDNGGSAFSSVRQRVARHLLDLAGAAGAASAAGGGVLVARISQQGLADAVGTVREVVVRTLRELRRDGLVDTGRGGIAISSAGAGCSPRRTRGPARGLRWWNTSPLPARKAAIRCGHDPLPAGHGLRIGGRGPVRRRCTVLIDCVVVGAGPAGLAARAALTAWRRACGVRAGPGRAELAQAAVGFLPAEQTGLDERDARRAGRDTYSPAAKSRATGRSPPAARSGGVGVARLVPPATGDVGNRRR